MRLERPGGEGSQGVTLISQEGLLGTSQAALSLGGSQFAALQSLKGLRDLSWPNPFVCIEQLSEGVGRLTWDTSIYRRNWA